MPPLVSSVEEYKYICVCTVCMSEGGWKAGSRPSTMEEAIYGRGLQSGLNTEGCLISKKKKLPGLRMQTAQASSQQLLSGAKKISIIFIQKLFRGDSP